MIMKKTSKTTAFWCKAAALAVGVPAAAVLLGLAVYAVVIQGANGRIVSGGEIRRYLLHVPPGYDPALPTPLVLSIHGFAEWPTHQAKISHWNQLADEENFIVVYPAGTGFPKRWRSNGGDDTDAQFIADLIEQLQAEYNIDPNRIYANGLSNGGGMSFLLSCQLSDRIAAFGGVAGAYLLPWEACQPVRPVPAILFHGNADPVVPFEGGPSRSFDIPFPVINDWVGILAERSGCEAVPDALPQQGEVSGVRYSGCTADVVYYTIAGGGHTWPGGGDMPRWLVGHTTRDIDATRLMWDFFVQHPLAETP
jgi:polyhydroxybutyrate depolymerase